MAYQFEKASKTIHHALAVAEVYATDYQDMSEYEIILATHAMLAAVRNARRVADDIERYVKNYIIDEFKLNYHKLRYDFLAIKDAWDEKYYAAESLNKIDIVSSQLNTIGAMTTLQNTFDSANKEIMDHLSNIISAFERIEKIQKTYAENEEERNRILNNTYERYLKSDLFLDKRNKFVREIHSYINVHGCNYDTYNVYLIGLENNGNTLFKLYLERCDIAKYMVENKCDINNHDVITFFYYRYVYDEVQKRMARFEYEGVCDSYYAGMFKTKAAEKLAVVFGQIFHNHIDKLKGNKYAMVMLAMKDMKLIEEGQYGLLFKDFVNSEILEQNRENPIADAKTITDVTKKVKNHPFKRLSADDLKDSGFDKNEFDRLSGFYWQCISIMNMVLEYNLKAKGFADYLCNTHPNTPDYDIFDNIAELKVLSSVLKGETPTI